MKDIRKKYLVLLSTCYYVTGFKRSILIDYAHDCLYYIDNSYCEILDLLKNNPIDTIRNQMDDDDSLQNFHEFLHFLLSHDMAILTYDKESFPALSEDLNDEDIDIIDAIVCLGEYNDTNNHKRICEELKKVRCRNLQIRQEVFNTFFLKSFLDIATNMGFFYIELHTNYNRDTPLLEIREMIESYASLQNIYLYGSETNKEIEVSNSVKGYVPIPLGKITFLKENLNNGKCCGKICIGNMDFSGRWVNSLLKRKNGCLYKKICIDTDGNIKNCPSMKYSYGNIRETAIKDVIQNPEFTKYWNITKDSIEVCKECEFRYNCTDCRAFLKDPRDLYSKPQKCFYNPYLGKWQ